MAPISELIEAPTCRARWEHSTTMRCLREYENGGNQLFTFCALRVSGITYCHGCKT
jgi:hypothetical protein